MAYEGSIEYMEIPLGQVHWSKNITSPFMEPSKRAPHMWYTGDRNCTEISARVFLLANVVSNKKSLVLDDSSHEDIEGLGCVVIGTRQSHWYSLQHHYVLLVRRVSGPEYQVPRYERAGVGTLETWDINFDSGENVIIL